MFNIPYFARFSDGREINFVLEVEDEIHLDDSLHCDRTLDERACDLASAKHDEGTEPFDVEICWTMIPGEKLLAVAGNVFAYVGYDGCFVGPYASFEIAKAALDAHVDYIMEHGP